MFTALLLSRETCQKLHSFRKEWHLRGTKCTSSQTNAAKFRWKRQILLSCQLQQNCCTASCWHVPIRLEVPKPARLKMHHYSVLGMKCDVEASWPAMRCKHSFSKPLVFGCQLFPTWPLPTPAYPLGNACLRQWGSEAAAQHVVRTPRACSPLLFLPCHLEQAVPWPLTSAKNLVKGLKLLQAREKIWSLKKDVSQPCSPSRALFVPFLILAHPKHVFKLLLPQPQELETCFKKKKKTKEKEKTP